MGCAGFALCTAVSSCAASVEELLASSSLQRDGAGELAPQVTRQECLVSVRVRDKRSKGS